MLNSYSEEFSETKKPIVPNKFTLGTEVLDIRRVFP